MVLPLSTASASKVNTRSPVKPIHQLTSFQRVPTYSSRGYDKPSSGGIIVLALCYTGVSQMTVVHKMAKRVSDWVIMLWRNLS